MERYQRHLQHLREADDCEIFQLFQPTLEDTMMDTNSQGLWAHSTGVYPDTSGAEDLAIHRPATSGHERHAEGFEDDLVAFPEGGDHGWARRRMG